MSDNDNIYDEELVRLVYDLRREDPLTMVIRAQAHIEHALRQFIISNSKSPHTLNSTLDFEMLTKFAEILGLNPDTRRSLTALSTLHRKLSRERNVEFGEHDADNLFKALSPMAKHVLHEVYHEFQTKENLAKFKRQRPEMRLVWLLIGIWSDLLSERIHGPEPHTPEPSIPPDYAEDIKQRRLNFFRLLDDGDDFQLVIRGHSHLDNELREFVLAAAKRPSAVNRLDLDYAGTIRLALALGLHTSLERGLSAIGALRNKFAHNFSIRLTSDHANHIFACLTSSERAEAEKAWMTTFHNLPNIGRPEKLSEASARDLIAISMVMIHSKILLQNLELRTTHLTFRQ